MKSTLVSHQGMRVQRNRENVVETVRRERREGREKGGDLRGQSKGGKRKRKAEKPGRKVICEGELRRDVT